MSALLGLGVLALGVLWGWGAIVAVAWMEEQGKRRGKRQPPVRRGKVATLAQSLTLSACLLGALAGCVAALWCAV